MISSDELRTGDLTPSTRRSSSVLLDQWCGRNVAVWERFPIALDLAFRSELQIPTTAVTLCTATGTLERNPKVDLVVPLLAELLQVPSLLKSISKCSVRLHRKRLEVLRKRSLRPKQMARKSLDRSESPFNRRCPNRGPSTTIARPGQASENS